MPRKQRLDALTRLRLRAQRISEGLEQNQREDACVVDGLHELVAGRLEVRSAKIVRKDSSPLPLHIL